MAFCTFGKMWDQNASTNLLRALTFMDSCLFLIFLVSNANKLLLGANTCLYPSRHHIDSSTGRHSSLYRCLKTSQRQQEYVLLVMQEYILIVFLGFRSQFLQFHVVEVAMNTDEQNVSYTAA